MATPRVKFGLKKYSGNPLPTEPTKSLMEIMPSKDGSDEAPMTTTTNTSSNEQDELAFRPGDLTSSIPATSSIEQDTTIADLEIDAAAAAAAAVPQYQAPPPVVLTLSQQIILSVKQGNLNAVEQLLDRAAREHLDDAANLKDEGDFPLLHWAALNDHVPIIECLVNRGANVRLKNGRGEEPLAWAALRGHRRASASLLRHGASEDAIDDRGYSVMHHAAQNNHVHLLDYYRRR